VVVGLPSGPFAPEGSATAPIFVGSFAPSSHPDLDIVTVLVSRGRSHFEQALEGWFARGGRVNGGSDANAAGGSSTFLHDQLHASPTMVDVAPGRRAELRSLWLGMGGTMMWATLQSKQADYDLTVVVELYASDYPLSDAERNAIRSLGDQQTFGRLLACLDRILWPS
jgi:hypothetical protein